MRRVNKLFLSTLVAGLCMNPPDVQAQDKKNDSYIVGDVGQFNPSDSGLQNIYGGGVTFGGGAGFTVNARWDVEIKIGYFNKTGEPIVIGDIDADASSKITIKSITASYIGRFKEERKNEEVNFYAGGGLGYYDVSEDIEARVGGDQMERNITKNTIGLHLLAGVEYPMDNTAFFGEIRYSNASVDGEGGISGDKVQVGGTTLAGGLKISFN